jgi:hypothetical protein
MIKCYHFLSGNDFEQTANTYKLDTFNKAVIKTSRPNFDNGKESTVNRALGGSTYPD